MSIRPVSNSSRAPIEMSEVSSRQNTGAVSHCSSLSSMDSHFEFCSGASNFIKNGWRSFTSFIRALWNRCFGGSSPSASARENRLDKSAGSIHKALSAEMRHCAKQMAEEPMKPFQYVNQDPFFGSVAEEMVVGNMQVGIAHAQGRRPTMEDEHLAVAFNVEIAGKVYPLQLFGIFDGHGGSAAAQYVRNNLRQELHEALNEFNGNGLTEAGIWKALKRACTRLDHNLKSAYPSHDGFSQGTTATIAMVLNEQLWTANVGDSRTILDNHGRAEQLSCDAKPNDSRFRKGIENRGGAVRTVFGVPRVNGDLAVARSFGDHRLGSAVSARPKITMKPLSEIQSGSQLILCCDGITDVARSADLAQAVHTNRFQPVSAVARNLVYSAYFAGSTDNLSAMVVKIR